MRFSAQAGWVVFAWAAACSVYDDGLLVVGAAGAGAGGGGGSTSGASGGTSGASTGGAGSGGAAASGGGGSAGSAGVTGSSAGNAGASDGGDGGQPPFIAGYESIDDMEDGNTTVVALDGRNGRWVTDNDGSGSTVPAKTMLALLVTELETADAREGSTHSVRLRATNFQAGDWGAFVGVHFRSPDSTPYDASAYCGIHFWAKRSADTTPVNSIEIRVPDKHTIPGPEGFCTDPAAAGGAGGGPGLCYDHHKKVEAIGTEWEEYTIYFSQLQQGGWLGYEQSALGEIDISAITSIEFFLNRPQVFDLWVDDLSFITKPQGEECP